MDSLTRKAPRSLHLRELHERLKASCERARDLAKDLDAAQLNWRPAAAAWSIAQCLEHTLLGADSYSENLRPVIDRAKAKQLGFEGNILPRHTMMGRLILRAVEPTAKRKMTSPRIFAPTQSEISGDVVERFIRSHGTIADLILDCDGLDINRLRLSSPVARLIRINVADAFTILVTHAERHLNQAQNVREAAGFPA